MRWFAGDIPSAIKTAKDSNTVFIVFVAGQDEKSRTMESYLHTEEVTKMCEDHQCVAIKIEAQSNDCKLFSQIYPLVVIPVTFFIGSTGVPLEVVGDCESKEDFVSRVQKAMTLHGSSPDAVGAAAAAPGPSSVSAPSPSTPLCPPASSQQTTAQPEKREAHLASAVSEKLVEEKSGTVPLDSPGSSGDGDNETKPDEEDQANLEARVERAKKLVEIKKEEKRRKEAEDERRKEIERRNVGQGVQKLRQQQKDLEILEAKRELKKDRDEDKIARQRVKEEIERDRAEKAARFNREKDERAQAAEEAKKKKLLEQQAAEAAEQARRSDFARIQFRLPDGSSVAQQFPATDTFASVHEFITQRMGTAVSLSMAFPRRTFTSEDHSLSLRDLQLAPTAVILVLPGGASNSQVRSSSGGLSVSSLVSLIFSPFFFVWRIVASIFGLGVTQNSSDPSASSSSRESRPSPASTAATSKAYGGDRDRGGAVKRPASSSRQEGSVRRFRNTQDDDDDEDRSTWNGNSTQQM